MPRDERYYAGPSIIRCARLRALGHGAQVLVSGSTADLLAGEMPPGSHLLPLGVHRLRDLAEPVRVFQVAHEKLPEEFPPLRSLDALPNNLPAAVSGFIGRHQQIADLGKLLEEHRLVSLVGPGGGGKTRLAAQVAASVLERCPDGVWWTDLAALSDPAQVPFALMNSLGIGDDRGMGPMKRVVEFLGEQRVLLVLDNCEHVLAAGATVLDAVLRGCPNASAMTTSREPLGLGGERVWRMTPLALPENETEGLSPEAALGYESVQLFVERAREVRPSFALDADTAPLVAAVCVRLDGLPLAIELAASRTRSLSPQRILSELDDRFRLLTGGSRTALGRQQTLAASVEWSHQLLSAAERAVFRRMAACAGGFTLDAAEAIAGDADLDAWEVLEVLSALVDKSLVTFDGERYGMLATLRDFAASQLLGSGEIAAVRDRHAAHFLARAEAASDLVERQIRHGLVDELRIDHDNLRTALEWSAARSTSDGADDDTAARLVAALMFFWLVTGHFTEGLAWHRRVLAALPQDPTPMRCQVIWGLGHLSLNCAELSNGLGMGELAQALELAQTLQDPKLIARPLAAQGCVLAIATGEDPTPVLTRALELAEAAGDEWAVSYVLWWEGAYWAWRRADRAGAEPALARLEEMGRRASNPSCLGWSDWIRGVGAWQTGELEEAWAEYERGIDRSRECEDPLLECMLFGFGGIETLIDLGRYDHAEALVRSASSRIRRTLDSCRAGVVEVSLARIAIARGELEVASREASAILPLVRASGLPVLIGLCQNIRGRSALEAGDLPAAREAFEEASAIAQSDRMPMGIAEAHRHQGLLARAEGHLGTAESELLAALAVQVRHGLRVRAAESLEVLAQLAAARESFVEAARLLGAADAAREATGGVRAPVDRPAHDAAVVALGTAIDAEAFAVARAAGAALSLEQVGEYALRARGERKRPSSGWESLTPTELQVVGLAATGLTNAQIGEKLFVSPGTVKTHLQNVYAKLGVANRAALAAEATARGLGSDSRKR